jgi:hypothetical protein
VSACQTGLQRHPAYLSARVTLGRAFQELGEDAAARTEFEYVLSIAPDNLLAIRGLAELREAPRGAAPAAPRPRAIESRPQEQSVSEPKAPGFGEVPFDPPHFNDADFAEAQLVESLIEPQFDEAGAAAPHDTGASFTQLDTDDPPVWDLKAAEPSHDVAVHRHEAEEIGAFRSWFEPEEPEVDPGELAKNESIDAAIDAAIRSAVETVREPSRVAQPPIYGPAEPPIAPMIEAVIDRASRAQRATQIERLEIWLERLEELRRDISGQRDA